MKRLQGLLITSALIIIIYIFINLIHITWKYISPEGIWSFWLFVTVFSLTFLVLVLVGLLIFFAFSLIKAIYNSLKHGFSKKEFELPLTLAVGIFTTIVFDFLIGFGPYVFINKKLADKYSYQNRSEILIEKGEYIKAIEEATNAYNKLEGQKNEIHPFFILSKLAQEKGIILSSPLEVKYGIILNYAYCTFIIKNDLEKAKKLYEEAIFLVKLEDSSESKRLKILPLIKILEIELQRRNYPEVEFLFREVKHLGDQVEGDEFFLYYYLIHGKYAIQLGDHFKANQLFAEAYEYYIEKEFSKKNSFFRVIAIKAVEANLALDKIEKAGDILVEITPQMNKRKDRVEYIQFLQVRAMYSLIAAQSNNGNREVLDRSFLKKLINGISPSWNFKYALAEKGFDDLKEAGKLIKKKEGENSINYASSLISIGGVYELQGNFKEAKNHYIQAKSIIENFKELDFEILNKTNLSIARVEYNLGNHEASLEIVGDVESYVFEKIRSNLPFLSEDEREKFILANEYGLNLTNAILTLTDRDNFSSKIYDNIVASKGMALASNLKFRNILQAQNQNLFNDYLNILKEKEAFDGILSTDSEIIKKKNQIELREKEFVRKLQQSLDFELVEVSQNTAKKIKDSLSEKEVAIEIFNIPTSQNFKDSLMYYAIVIKKDYDNPKIIQLFSDYELKSVLDVSGGFVNQINKIYAEKKEDIYKLLWSKLVVETNKVEKVFLSVSGTLNSVSISSVLIERPFELIMLSSTKNILDDQDFQSNELTKASIFGDPSFASTDYRSLNLIKEENNPNSKEIRGNIFENLPFTRKEAIEITKLLQENSNTEVALFLDQDASEENFRKLKVSERNLLHLATHGFYLENKVKKNNSLIKFGNQSPLLSTGLILAGPSNRELISGNNDGIVTAMDISKLDFSNTDLVVLSACETGLGEIIGGEGVFGLQRAFKIAGAKAIMVSLWKVPDAQTSELMEEFYSKLTIGYSPEKSLREAQLEIRKKYNEPFYWAGFVLISN